MSCIRRTQQESPSVKKQRRNEDTGLHAEEIPSEFKRQFAETGHLHYDHNKGLIEFSNGHSLKQMQKHFKNYPEDMIRLVTGDDTCRQFIMRNMTTLNHVEMMEKLLEIQPVKYSPYIDMALCQKVEEGLTVFLLALRLQRHEIIKLLLPFVLQFDVKSLPTPSTSRARVKTALDPLDGKSLLEAALQMQTSVQILRYLINEHALTAAMVKTTESVQMAIKYLVPIKMLRLLRNYGAPYSYEYLKIASEQLYPRHAYLFFFLKWEKDLSESPAPLRAELYLLGPLIERHSIGGFKAVHDSDKLIFELKRLADLGLRFDPEQDKELIEKNDMAKEVSRYIATIDKVGK